MSDLSLNEQYVLYIDLLGYKAIMNEMSERAFLETIDNSLNEAIKTITTMSKPTHSKSVFTYKVFSDNIVVATIADSTYALYSLSYIAYILQREFVDKKIMCRGSITKGKLYISREYVFGSGLIRSHELENRVAYYPRIILDRLPETSELIKNYDVYCQDQDGYVMIDYLRVRDEHDIQSVFLAKHKQFIEYGLEKYHTNERIFQKYAWCRGYHNSSCIRFNLTFMSIK
jgi:hypothetical protein